MRRASSPATHRDDSADVRGLTVELSHLEDALEQVGWDYEAADEPVELTAHPELITDVMAAAVTDAVETFEEVLDRCRRGQAHPVALQAGWCSVSGCLDLFVAAYDPRSS